MRKKIGLVGLDNNKILYFKKKYKKFDFLKINDQNFFSPESLKNSDR